MARETAALNERAVALLALQPTDRVLEVGFGHGRTIARIASAVAEGHVAGIDVSDTMTKVATRRNRTAVEAGRVELATADAAALPFDAGAFDKVLSVHTLYFWRDPAACLREIRRALRHGGVIVLGFAPKRHPRIASFPAEVYTFYDDEEVRAMLTAAGFGSVEMVDVGPNVLARAAAA